MLHDTKWGCRGSGMGGLEGMDGLREGEGDRETKKNHLKNGRHKTASIQKNIHLKVNDTNKSIKEIPLKMH